MVDAVAVLLNIIDEICVQFDKYKCNMHAIFISYNLRSVWSSEYQWILNGDKTMNFVLYVLREYETDIFAEYALAYIFVNRGITLVIVRARQ